MAKRRHGTNNLIVLIRNRIDVHQHRNPGAVGTFEDHFCFVARMTGLKYAGHRRRSGRHKGAVSIKSLNGAAKPNRLIAESWFASPQFGSFVVVLTNDACPVTFVNGALRTRETTWAFSHR